MMKKLLLTLCLLMTAVLATTAQQRRPIDSRHPLWLVHVDVWNQADPQKIINLIPDDIKPYVCMNLSLSCQYDTEKNVYKMPQNAVRTYKSWATVCQANNLWFTCQPASGGHTHIQDDDMATFEYFFKHYPNFLGWNYAEQFWGFDESGDKSSSTQASRLALFARLIPLSHRYGGMLTVSFCGNVWSHPLNPTGMMKRNADLWQACRDYPESIVWLYKYTTSSCFYNNESVTIGPFIAGLATNYGVRYDNCGYNGALTALLGEGHGKPYPVAAGIGTVMEQTAVNGGAIWDGPELIWTEDFKNLPNSTVDGWTTRNWERFPGFTAAWIDMFRKIIDGSLYIPTRSEVVDNTKIVVINNVNSGNDEQRYATWGSLYDGLYKQQDPMNKGNGQWMDNYCYFKKTGRYGTIPMVPELYDDLAKAIPVQVKKSNYTQRWSSETKKVADFNAQYGEMSKGDLFVSRYKNQIVAYTPYSYLNGKETAQGDMALNYNTCDSLKMTLGRLSSALVREEAGQIRFYLNNYRTDSTTLKTDRIVITGVSEQPSYELKKRAGARGGVTPTWDGDQGIYTIAVKHCGPVDLTINCQGTNERMTTEPLPTFALTEDLPVQPAEYHGELIIEAEDMDYKNIRQCTTSPYNTHPNVRGHAGNGFMDMGTNTTGALRYKWNAPDAGAYRVAVRYQSTAKGGNINVSANGAAQSLLCAKTEGNEWKKAVADVTLKAGQNELMLTNTSGLNMLIDQVIVTPADQAADLFAIELREADHGSLTANKSEAHEGDTVTLSVNADEGYALKELRVVSSVFYTQDLTLDFDPASETITFVMPDDNVTIQPKFADLSAAYHLDFSQVLSGTLPEGWRVKQENSEVHEYPNSYTSGARTFAGFGGYQGKGLYWRGECAEYGRQDAYPLELEAGDYKLVWAMAAWKEQPKYRAKIVDAVSGSTLATTATLTATPNANGSTTADLSAARGQELKFAVANAGRYVVSFANAEAPTAGMREFLLLECRVNKDLSSAGITTVSSDNSTIKHIYTTDGVARTRLHRGVNLIRRDDGSIQKLYVK